MSSNLYCWKRDFESDHGMSVDDRYAANQQGIQHPLSVPAGGVKDHTSGQPEEHQACPGGAPLSRDGSHVSLIKVVTQRQTTTIINKSAECIFD